MWNKLKRDKTPETAAPAPHWHKPSECLPEKDKQCCLLITGHLGIFGYWGVAEQMWKSSNSDKYGDWTFPKDVRAWMAIDWPEWLALDE